MVRLNRSDPTLCASQGVWGRSRFNGAQSRTRCPLSTRDAATVLDGVKGLFASLTGFAALDPVFTRCRTG